MGITVEVAGVDRTAEWFREAPTGWDDQLNGRGTGRITFTDDVGGWRPEDGQTVEIIEDGTVRFGGIIMEPSETEPEGAGVLFFECTISDYNILADRRTVGENFESTAFELIVSGIVTNWMTDEGIDLSGVETGPDLSPSFPNVSATEAFNALSDATGRAWWIDENKVLNFKDRASVAAPADLDGDTLLAGTIKVRTDRQKYRNEQIVRAGSDEFPIMAVSGNLTEQAARAAIEGTSGIYSNVHDDPEITRQDNALESAGDILARFDEITLVVDGRTRTQGFRAGQSANVHLPKHNVTNTEMLIDSVGAEIISVGNDDDEIWYTVSAITGDPFGGYLDHFRKAPPIKLPLTFANTPGLFRVDPLPGAIVHDPEPDGTTWFQGPEIGPVTLPPNVLGITHEIAGNNGFVVSIRRGGAANTDGCGGGTFPGFGGTPACFAGRQTIMSKRAIDDDETVASVPISGASWDELQGSSFKASMVIDPTNTLMCFIERDSVGGDPVFGVVGLDGTGFRGSVAATGMVDNNTGFEGAWVGDYVYIPATVAGGSIFVFNVSDPDVPTLEDEFVTSATGTITSCVASADGQALYCVETGGTGLLIALDISDPSTIVEDDTLALSATTYTSLDIDLNSSFLTPQLAMFRRVNGSNLGYAVVPVTGTTIGVADEGTLPVATASTMDGATCVYDNDTAICWRSKRAGSPANSHEAHVFKIDPDDGVSFVETLTYNHGTTNNLDQSRSTIGNRVAFDFDAGQLQVTYGEIQYNESVPLTIDHPLRVGFGGTGIASFNTGDLLYAGRQLPDTSRGFGALTARAIGVATEVMMVSAGLPTWLPQSAIVHANLGGLTSTADHPGYVTLDGLRPLTAPWDAGSFKITAEQFESDVATGTAPFIVASTTEVSNLNAALLQGNAASAFALASHVHAAADITSGTFADARIAESNVTQHQAALSITESQISDLVHTVATLASVGDVTITAIASGELLKWNGAAWINNTLAEAGIAAASHTHVVADLTDRSTQALQLNDNVSVTLGTGSDATLLYDGTNVILNTRAAGTGNFNLAGGNLIVDSTGPHGMGVAASTQWGWNFSGTYTSSGGTSAAFFSQTGVLQAGSGQTSWQTSYRLGGQILTQGATEVIANVSGLRLLPPNITVGTGDTITQTATLIITGAATEGTTNWSLQVLSGLCGFGGGVAIAAAQKLFLDGYDGLGNSYIYQVSADLIRVVAGGTTMLDIDFGNSYNLSYQEVRIASGKDLVMVSGAIKDASGNTVIGAIAANLSTCTLIGGGTIGDSVFGTGSGGFGGFQVGAPTGGNKGAGTINVATAVYKNNTAYTNPDYVFEHAFTGSIVKFADNPGASEYAGLMPLADVREHARETMRLPYHLGDDAACIFDRSDWLLARVEEAYLYIFQLNDRIAQLEAA